MSATTNDPSQVLRDLKPEHEFFIGIDSDGCVFDSMEIKHKECFCPAFVNHYGLQDGWPLAGHVAACVILI